MTRLVAFVSFFQIETETEKTSVMTMAMVNVLVKNVYAPEDSQQLALEESLSIRALKELLQRELPDHPAPSQQRLIFAGKICDDQQTLQTVLAGHAQDQRSTANGDQEKSEDQAPFVFHLMVTSPLSRRRTSTPPPVKTEKVETPPTTGSSSTSNATTPPSELPVPSPPASAVPVTTTAAAPLNVPTPQWPFGFTAPPTSTPTTAATSHHPQQQQQQFHQQQQLFQQAFLMQQQIMILAQIHYLQQLKAHQEALTRAQSSQPAMPQPGNVGHNPFLNFGFGGGLAGPQQTPAPAAAYHGAHHQVHHPAAAQPPMPAQPAAAAAAAVPPAEPAPPRGALGQALREVLPLVDLRLAFKMAFMLFIIGQDAPQDRLVILGLMSFIGYLHTTGILAKIYEIYVRLSSANAAAQNPNANPHANADGNANDAAAGAAGVQGDGDAQGNNGPQGFARLLRISPDRGFFQDVRNFLAGFFLSLAPFWYPQPLNGDAPRVVREQPAMPDDFPLQGI